MGPKTLKKELSIAPRRREREIACELKFVLIKDSRRSPSKDFLAKKNPSARLRYATSARACYFPHRKDIIFNIVFLISLKCDDEWGFFQPVESARHSGISNAINYVEQFKKPPESGGFLIFFKSGDQIRQN